MSAGPTHLWCRQALLPDGWAADVRLTVDDSGQIASVFTGPAAAGDARLDGWVLPGMPNLHSHAFQRAMAGLTERPGPDRKGDDFWSWRRTMYDFVARLSPDAVEAIATQLYTEMLEAGYTAVAEFHYLHNGPDGTPYGDPAELSRRLARAADKVGIRLTLLPVLYQQSGFGGAPLGEAQRRFHLTTDAWLDLIATLDRDLDPATQQVGAALHSLRAVTAEALSTAVDGYRRLRPEGPIHIHIAEQIREVDDCLAWSGARPVDWLLDNAPVDARWTLVHATHMTDGERARMAASGAVAGLCPTTEANLGDGVFPLPEWLAENAGGCFGIGSDSNVAIDPREELRWLEYAQRLTRQARVVALPDDRDSLGDTLYGGALAGGALALGQPAGRIAPGAPADLLVLDKDHPTLAGHDGDTLLDAWLFATAGSALADVWVAGRQVVADGRHPHRDETAAAYRKYISTLKESLA